MPQILIENEARQILDKSNICLVKKVSRGHNRAANNPNPDYVEYAIFKNGDMLFKFSTRTTLKPEETDTKTLGTEVVEKCLECASGEEYNNQGEFLYAAISRYLNPQSEMEAQEFEEICHDLEYFNVQNDLSTGMPSYKVNIALVEENRELLSKTLEELKAIEASRASQKQ
jgi:hypothetical protein